MVAWGPALHTYTCGVNNAHTDTWKILHNTPAVELISLYKEESGEDPAAVQILAAPNAVQKPEVNLQIITQGIQDVISYMAPTKALAKQQAWIRCYHCRPHDMTTKVFLNHLVRINNKELPSLPPKFDENQSSPMMKHLLWLSNMVHVI
jgi:hypothetical protein